MESKRKPGKKERQKAKKAKEASEKAGVELEVKPAQPPPKTAKQQRQTTRNRQKKITKRFLNSVESEAMAAAYDTRPPVNQPRQYDLTVSTSSYKEHRQQRPMYYTVKSAVEAVDETFSVRPAERAWPPEPRAVTPPANEDFEEPTTAPQP